MKKTREQEALAPSAGHSPEVAAAGESDALRHELERLRSENVRLKRTLHRVQQIARLGYWKLSLKTQDVFWSDVIYDIFGVAASSFTPSVEAFKQRVHPEDLPMVEAAIAKALGRGNYDVIHRIIRPNGEVRWVHELADYVPDDDDQMLIGTLRDITDQKILEQRLRLLSRTDELTGLFNRRYFMKRLVQELARFRRYARPASVILFDFDHFKRINDTHGHPAGDQVLVQTSRMLRGKLRVNDIPARLGGEEFAILLPETELDGAIGVAEKLRQQVSALSFASEEGHLFTASITCGVSAFRDREETIEATLHRADRNLYQGKRAGRNRVIADEWDS
ncbi:GGDEF domain-containing protein [Halomonas sp. E14]|uniref:GGDEF domain-containing protein n=1 Tax=Halomonas sp. E14 TaxID=3397245 RepID=UPI00403EAB84